MWVSVPYHIIHHLGQPTQIFRESIAMAHSDRDIGLYHWSNQRLSDSWKSTFSVLVARERARVGLAAATQDWARRVNRMRDCDQEDHGAGY